MSEPDAAFLKLRIARSDLVRWLDARPPAAHDWDDWRAIGGQWYFSEGVADIATISDADYRQQVAETDAWLGRYGSNREALRALLIDTWDRGYTSVAYDAVTQDFVAGSLAYSENLTEMMVFLTVARGGAAYLDAGQHGTAVIHNYLWGDADDRITQAALRLGPDGRSEFVDERERASAAGVFQALADRATGAAGPSPTPGTDALDTLR